MGKEEAIKTRLLQSIINYVRENYKAEIDKAYEYFWDDNQPDEFLSGTALELGFINFEDWLVFDYKVKGNKETFIDLYVKNGNSLSGEERNIIGKIQNSFLSLYEVKAVSKDRRVLLNDLLVGHEVSLRNKTLTRGLNKGDIFASRFLPLDQKDVMSGCVYPYSQAQKKRVLGYINTQYARYKRNVNPAGTLRDYLKDYGDVFNIIWMNFILDPPLKES